MLHDLSGHSGWSALFVRSGLEAIAERSLSQGGYQTYLPQKQRNHKRGFRNRPLFPNYVFCHLKTADHRRILMTPGVVAVVKTCAGSIIPGRDIMTLQRTVASNLRYHVGPLPPAGHHIRIKHGPLAGAEGALFGTPEKGKLVIPITVLGCAVFVHVNPDHFDQVSQEDGDADRDDELNNRLRSSLKRHIG
jgi:hypothetical protein